MGGGNPADPVTEAKAPGRPRHTVGGLAARLAVLEARVDQMATRSDVRAILEELIAQQRRHRRTVIAAAIPLILTSAAALAEIVRVFALGRI